MSRRRLIASLSVVGCGLVAVTVLAVTVFPLKAAPRATARVQEAQAASEAVVNESAIWTGRVQRGTMYIAVRGLGTLALLNGQPVAKIELAEDQAADVRSGQNAEVDTHKGVVKGHVSQISREVIIGKRSVLITLDSAVPSGVDAQASVDGTVVVGKLENVAYVTRPADMKADSRGDIVVPVFKIINNGKDAEKIYAQFGRASVHTIQVLSGLKPGDTVILSDMSPYEKYEHVEIKRAS